MGQWQPGPVQEQPPELHVEKEHVAPCAHASWQPPAEHATVHVAPLGHDVLQCPLEQSMVQVPAPQ